MSIQEINKIINTLRDAITLKTMDAEILLHETKNLQRLDYFYKSDLFPTLPNGHDWGVANSPSPSSLAEALLWKMGKWNIYQSFASHYSTEDTQAKETDVVFFAFAKHLRDRSKPIYDQHALRALWAIDTGLNQQQSLICKSVLISKGEWKAIASGKYSIAAYHLYLSRMDYLCSLDGSVTLEILDKLLMPLGQAIKKNTDYESFSKLINI